MTNKELLDNWWDDVKDVTLFSKETLDDVFEPELEKTNNEKEYVERVKMCYKAVATNIFGL